MIECARLILLFLVATAGCAELSPFSRNVCGNGVVEPDNGEDCDSFPDSACGAPKSVGECHFLCSTSSAEATCPEGFGCGADGLCRRPTDTYVAGSVLRHDVVFRLAAGDFDEDGIADLLTMGDTGTQAHFFEPPGNFRAVTVTKRSNDTSVFPLGINGAHRDDLLVVDTRIPDTAGLLVYEASNEKVFVPQHVFAAELLGLTDLVAAGVYTGISAPPAGPQEYLVFSRSETGDTLVSIEDRNTLNLPSHERLAAPLLVGQLDDDATRSPCDEVGLIFQGSDQIWLFTTCYRDKQGLAWNVGSDGAPIVTLPSVKQRDGQVIDGAILADANQDGHLDIIAWSEATGACAALYRAYGVGDGTFNSTPSVPTTGGDGFLAPFGPGEALSGRECVQNHSPLLIADLNQDGKLEVVTRDGVFSGGIPLLQAGDVPWESAVIGDFDADGRPDLAVTGESPRGIRIVNDFTQHGIRRAVTLPTSGSPTELTTGDFDGDGVQDLAFLDRTSMGDTGAAVSVAYGQAFGTSELIRKIDNFSSSSKLTAALVDSPFRATDAISDLLVIQPPDFINVIIGDPSRELTAPVVFDLLYNTDDLTAKRASAGRFGVNGTPAIASIAQIGDVLTEQSLEIVHVTPEGNLDFGATTPEHTANGLPTASGFSYSSFAALAPIDLTGDGVDELVMVANVQPTASGGAADTPSKGQLLVAQRAFPPSEAAWRFSVPTVVEESFGPDDLDVSEPSFVDARHVCVGDFDHDGKKDVLTFGKAGDTSVLALYRSDGSGDLDPARRVVFQSGALEFHAATSIRPFPANADGRPRIALLTPSGVFLAELDVEHAMLAMVGNSLTLPAPLLPSIVANDLSSGDFNADGVLDLAVASGEGVQLFFGVPASR